MSKNNDLEPKLTEDISEEKLPQAEDDIEEAAEAAAEDTEAAVEETAEEASAEESADEIAEESTEADSEMEDDDDAADKEEKKKKPFILQVPVLISLGIVLAALIGYLVYTFFFLHIPEGVIWSATYKDSNDKDIVYYFEFNEDGTMKTTVGTIELSGYYQRTTTEDGDNALAFKYSICDFVAGMEAKYDITGSRILGNQEITFTYGEGDSSYSFTLNQVKDIANPLELPDEFTPDEALLGDWYFSYYGTEYYLTFNEDGSMKMKFVSGYGENQYTEIDNGTYSVDNGTLSFTYCVSEPSVRLIEYQVSGNTLVYAGMPFDRVGADATPDEA